MNKKLFALLTLSIIGLTCVGETTCMKRQREDEVPQQDEQEKRRKEEQASALPASTESEKPEVAVDEGRRNGHRSQRRRFRVNGAYRVEIIKDEAPRIKPISGSFTRSQGSTFSPDGIRELLLTGESAGVLINPGPNQIHLVGTTNTDISREELKVAITNAYNNWQRNLAQRNQQLQQQARLPNAKQEDFKD